MINVQRKKCIDIMFYLLLVCCGEVFLLKVIAVVVCMVLIFFTPVVCDIRMKFLIK